MRLDLDNSSTYMYMVPDISSCFFARKYILGWDKNTNGKTAITWYWSEGELGNIVVQPRLPKFGNGNNPGKFLKKKIRY